MISNVVDKISCIFRNYNSCIFLLYQKSSVIFTQMLHLSKKTKLTISKTTYPIQSGHFDDKCKYIIDEGVECLVGHHPPWKMGHRLHLVIDEQLRCHHDET